jgi:predicted metalloendopeptidase
MNEDAINKLGNKPLQPLLKSVESVKDLASLTSHLAQMGRNDNGGETTHL